MYCIYNILANSVRRLSKPSEQSNGRVKRKAKTA